MTVLYYCCRTVIKALFYSFIFEERKDMHYKALIMILSPLWGIKPVIGQIRIKKIKDLTVDIIEMVSI